MKLFIVGNPSPYAGGDSELHHSIRGWKQSFPEIELHIIPTHHNYTKSCLYQEMVDLGIVYEPYRAYENITKDDAVYSICNGDFLIDIPIIAEQTKRIAWNNPMTFCFEKEKEIAHKGYISHWLYQRQGAMKEITKRLKARNFSEIGKREMVGKIMLFKPYFDTSLIQFSINDHPTTNIGHISRNDPAKFHENTLHIYEYIVSPKIKRGIFLGYGDNITEKIGKPHSWIQTYKDHRELSIKDFYNQIDFIVQPTNTTENWPRIGLEAMYSGKPLVVDNRGGWQSMLEHEVSGFLCNHERDFIYWGSRLAYDDELRSKIALMARQRAEEHSSLEVSTASWKPIFEDLFS